MNKLITCLALIATMIVCAPHQSDAQNSLRANSPTATVYADTITNAADVYLYTPSYSGKQSVLSVYVKLTSLSGTLAATGTLQASLVGGTTAADWYNVYDTQSDTTYTKTFDASNRTYRWQLHDSGDTYYRVLLDGSGIQSTRAEGKVSVK